MVKKRGTNSFIRVLSFVHSIQLSMCSTAYIIVEAMRPIIKSNTLSSSVSAR